VTRLAIHYQDLEKQAHAVKLGVWIFVASELMIFAGLFGTYAALRCEAPREFAAACRHSALAIGTINTGILLTSSLLVALAVHSVREARARAGALLLAGAVLLGAAFLALKGTEYAAHLREGIAPGVRGQADALATPGARAFFNLYYLMTGLHAVHVLAGSIVLAWLAVQTARGVYGPAEHDHVALELGGVYWHFVDVVWLFLWPMFYLLR